MTYVLHGVIGSAVTLQPFRRFTRAVVVPLSEALSLLPMTSELFDELPHGDTADPRFAPCRRFPSGFEQTLGDCSASGPVAYVEVDFWGGTGSQFAAVWDGGELVLGPVVKAEDDPIWAPGQSPVSQALCRLGVSADGHYDAFDAIGLGRHRRVADWLPDNVSAE